MRMGVVKEAWLDLSRVVLSSTCLLRFCGISSVSIARLKEKLKRNLTCGDFPSISSSISSGKQKILWISIVGWVELETIVSQVLKCTNNYIDRFHHNGDGNCRKRINEVECPRDGLDLSPWLKGSVTTRATYDMYAISNHYGSMEGGHYTAFCRNTEWVLLTNYPNPRTTINSMSPILIIQTLINILLLCVGVGPNLMIRKFPSFPCVKCVRQPPIFCSTKSRIN